MTPTENAVRLYVYEHFVAAGRAPLASEVASGLGTPVVPVHDALRSLEEQHVLVLYENTSEVRMAMPFSAEPTSFSVVSGASTWWANCIWDALGVPAMLEKSAVIAIASPVDGEDTQLAIGPDGPDPGTPGCVHFAVPAAHWWDDVVFT